MKIQSILFVTPSLGMGGTNPSLEALYNHVKDLYDIHVFAIAHQSRARRYSFDEVLLPQSAPLSMLYTDYYKQRGFNKVIAFVFKTTQTLFRYFKIDLKMIVARQVVKSLESCYSFDNVIAYQEGFATQFVSYFQNLNKIAWIHCNYDNWMPKEKSELTLYSKYKTIVCVSEYTASVFANRYNSLIDRVVAIYNLIDSERIQLLSKYTIEDDRFKTDKFTLLSAGRFNSVKRFREIPRIASYLKNHSIKFNWYILGVENDVSEMYAFQQGLISYDVNDCVKWLGGKSNPYPYFKSSDIYICTSESEACPMVFIEAKILGLPVLTTDFPSAYEFIEDGENGLVAPIDKLANTIIEVINNREVYFKFKNKMTDFVFDNKAIIDKVVSILN